MAKTKTIVFDIDGVLADFLGGFKKLAIELGGCWPQSVEDHTWDNYGGMPQDRVTQTWRHVAQHSGFWLGLEPLLSSEDMDNIASLMHTGHKLYFVTARPTPGALAASHSWLASHLPAVHPYISVIETKRKGEFCKCVDANFMIDDKSENVDCTAWITEGRTQAYILDRPYNSGAHAPHSSKVKRVQTVSQFIEQVLA